MYFLRIVEFTASLGMLKVQKAGKIEVFEQETNRDTFVASCHDFKAKKVVKYAAKIGTRWYIRVTIVKTYFGSMGFRRSKSCHDYSKLCHNLGRSLPI
jgi:hypothetical protein